MEESIVPIKSYYTKPKTLFHMFYDMIYPSNDNYVKSSCTGFYVRPNYIVTCRHCVVDDDNNIADKIEIGNYSGKLIGLSKEYDIAVLKIDKNNDVKPGRPIYLERKELYQGMAVSNFCFHCFDNSKKKTQAKTTGIISAITNNNEKISSDKFVHTCLTLPGCSGSPILHNNKYIGMTTSSWRVHNQYTFGFGINGILLDKTVNNLIEKELENQKEIEYETNKRNKMINDNHIIDSNNVREILYTMML